MGVATWGSRLRENPRLREVSLTGKCLGGLSAGPQNQPQAPPGKRVPQSTINQSKPTPFQTHPLAGFGAPPSGRFWGARRQLDELTAESPDRSFS